jgi:hypothetical protein
MVDTVTRARPGSRSGQARRDRLEMLNRESAPERVKVLPGSDSMQRRLEHPTGIGLRAKGASDWPLDTFTKRRLKEGAIILAPKDAPKEAPRKAPEPEPEAETLNT